MKPELGFGILGLLAVVLICLPVLDGLQKVARGEADSRSYPRLSRILPQKALLTYRLLSLSLAIAFALILLFAGEFDLIVVLVILGILVALFIFEERIRSPSTKDGVD